jgi:hypothetical protein
VNAVIEWLLEGDASIRWQVRRDLLDDPPQLAAEERRLVAVSGWGAQLLARQAPDGTWGGGLYSPKWTSTTYTLLLLRDLGLPAGHPQALRGCSLLLERGLYTDGGINLWASFKHSETCVTGMVLSFLASFEFPDERIHILAGHLLAHQLADGGWNCEAHQGATHSSFHTTISVLEGLRTYELFEPRRLEAVRAAQAGGREFLLAHRLYRSHRTGEIVHPDLTRFSFPPRWHYDVLRGLDYFQACRAERDERLQDAIELVEARRKPDGRWLLQNEYKGRQHFRLEQVGQPSRWNTLRALRILRWWNTPQTR